jgi:hypothetical protein
MTDIDTSSYRLPVKSASENLRDFQGIQANQIGIDQAKLKLVNDHYENMIKDLNTLGPNPTSDQLLDTAKQSLKYKRITPDMYATFVSNVPKDPSQIPAYRDKIASQLMSTQEAVNFHYGSPSYINNGQQTTPVRQGPRGGPVAVGLPIQQQVPPTQEQVTPEGNRLTGPQNPQLPEGTGQARGGIPGQVSPMRASTSPAAPAGPATSQAPLFEEGKKMLADDQTLATAKLSDIKPAQQALGLMKNLQSGPGTEAWNNAVARLKAFNILSTGANDPTAIYQEVNKYMNQYVQKNGSRSDADLAQRAASNPNVGTQINPALMQLTRNQIGLDRAQAIRPGAFEGNDLSKYGKHASTFPAQIDHRALTIDLPMEPEERKALLDKMKDAKDTPEGKKFWKTLFIAKQQGILNQ